MRIVVRKIFISKTKDKLKSRSQCLPKRNNVDQDMSLLPAIIVMRKKEKDLLIKTCLNYHLFSL